MTKGAEDDVSLCVLSGFSSYRQQKLYTDNQSGISARQRVSKFSMTNLVSAEDDVNLPVLTGLSAAIDEGRRRQSLSLRVIRLFVLQTAKSLYG